MSLLRWHSSGTNTPVHGVQLPSRSSASVPPGIVPTSRRCRITATSSIRHPTASSRTAPPAQLLWPTGFLCGCYVGLEFPLLISAVVWVVCGGPQPGCKLVMSLLSFSFITVPTKFPPSLRNILRNCFTLELLLTHHPTVPRYQLSTFGRRAFSVAGPTVWNSLPDSLRDRRSAARASDNRWRRICFVVTTQHTQRSRDASWLCAV